MRNGFNPFKKARGCLILMGGVGPINQLNEAKNWWEICLGSTKEEGKESYWPIDTFVVVGDHVLNLPNPHCLLLSKVIWQALAIETHRAY